MPRRYEDEINEILGKYDWPSDNRARRPQYGQPTRRSEPLAGIGDFLAHFGGQQLMLFGLILIVVGALLHFGDSLGMGARIGTDATGIGFLVLLGGYILAVVKGPSGLGTGRHQAFWRGQVVDLRPSNRGLGYWLWRLRANLRRPRR